MSQHAEPSEAPRASQPHKPAFGSGRPRTRGDAAETASDFGVAVGSDTNPWLIVLAVLALAAFVTGVAMYTANAPTTFGGGDSSLQLVGIWLIGAGVSACGLLFAAAAVCWQLKRR